MFIVATARVYKVLKKGSQSFPYRPSLMLVQVIKVVHDFRDADGVILTTAKAKFRRCLCRDAQGIESHEIGFDDRMTAEAAGL
jgi:hypothetical protein